MLKSLNFLIGVGKVEMEKKENAFNYLNAKTILIIYSMQFKSHEISNKLRIAHEVLIT